MIRIANLNERSKMKKQFLLVSILLVAVLAFATACEKKQQRSAISGEVTSNGEPVPTGMVQFSPENPDPTVSVVGGTAEIVNGHYEIPAQPNGLMPGKYNVKVVASIMVDKNGNIIDPDDLKDGKIPPGSGTVKDLVPPKYGSESELTVEIGNTKSTTYDINMIE